MLGHQCRYKKSQGSESVFIFYRFKDPQSFHIFYWFISLLFCSSKTANLFFLISSCSGVLPPSSFLVKDSKGFFSFSDSADFFSTELEVLGLAPVSEGVLKVAEAVGEASEIVGVETEVGKTVETGAGADKLVEAEMLDPNEDVVEEVEASAVVDETAVVVLLSVMTVVVETAVELTELADSADAAADDEVAATAGVCVVFLATTALYCCISITAASSNTWMFRRQRIRASTAVRS